MEAFKLGIYRHFKGGIYIAYGIGHFQTLGERDRLFSVAKDSEDRRFVDVFKRGKEQDFVLNNSAQGPEIEPGLPFVVYQALYGEGGFWVRSLDDFNGNKDMGNGEEIERFNYLGREIPDDFFEHFDNYQN